MIIRNVHLIDFSHGTVVRDMEVIVDGGRFVEIRRSSQSEGLPILDGKGGFLIPGLWEAHTHLVAPGKHGVEEVDTIGQLVDDYVRCGITTVVDLGGSVETLTAVRRRAELCPGSARVLFAGPVFTGRDGWPLCFHHDHSKALEPRTPTEAREHVLALRGRVDFVKAIYDGIEDRDDKLPKVVLGALIDAAHEIGVRAIVHVKGAQDVWDAVELRADCLEHAFIPKNPTDTREAEEVAALLARYGTYYCPTLVTWEQIARMGDLSYLAELEASGLTAARNQAQGRREFPRHPKSECRVRLDYGMKFVRILRDAGVKVVAGSDVSFAMPAPHALFRELQLLSKAGLSNLDVLRAATVYAAERTGRGQAGIQPGHTADAVLVTANPLEDIQAVVEAKYRSAVLRNGVHLSGEERNGGSSSKIPP